MRKLLEILRGIFFMEKLSIFYHRRVMNLPIETKLYLVYFFRVKCNCLDRSRTTISVFV